MNHGNRPSMLPTSVPVARDWLAPPPELARACRYAVNSRRLGEISAADANAAMKAAYLRYVGGIDVDYFAGAGRRPGL